MFRGSCRIRRAGVVLLLLASLSAGFTALPHADDCDGECGPIAVAHDENAHHVGVTATTASGETEHCILCHSLRSLYGTFGKFEQHHYGRRAERLHIAPLDRARLVAWTLVPGRAPPA
jgi:hypothetical protein